MAPLTAARVRLIAMVGIVAISFSAILVRAAATSPGTSAFFRVAYAVPLLAVVWVLARHRAGPRRTGRARLLALAAGVFFALDLNLWHRAIDLVGAGLATVLGNLQVVMVAVLAWVIHGERPRAAALVAVPVAFLGVALTSGLGRADAYGSAPVLGAVLGVLTAAAYTGYLLTLRQAGAQLAHPAGPILDATASAAVVGFVLAVVFDPAFRLAPTWPAHGWLVLLAWGAHSVGWLSIAVALPRLPALETSVLLLVQPCLTVLWGVLLFREAPSTLQWLGIALVLGSVAAVSLAGGGRHGPRPAPGPDAPGATADRP